MITIFLEFRYSLLLQNDFLISGQVLAAQMSAAPRTLLHFSVEVETVRPWEHVFVTGSVPALGGWIPSDAFLLYPDPDSALVIYCSFALFNKSKKFLRKRFI